MLEIKLQESIGQKKIGKLVNKLKLVLFYEKTPLSWYYSYLIKSLYYYKKINKRLYYSR